MTRSVSPVGRAVRWDGTNRLAVETLTGTLAADSVLDESMLVVDAWGAALLCPRGWWVVKGADGRLRVLSPAQFAAARRGGRTRLLEEAA